MKCLSILIAGRSSSTDPLLGDFIAHIWQVIYLDTIPHQAGFIIRAEFEADASERGLPVEFAADLVSPSGQRDRLSGGTGVVQMPMADEMPPIFGIDHEVSTSITESGRHEVELYINGTLAGSRPLGFFVKDTTEN